jgi:hypothetical protein
MSSTSAAVERGVPAMTGGEGVGIATRRLAHPLQARVVETCQPTSWAS